MDNLLRAYVSRPSNPNQPCTEFDPDRASAYIERSLSGTARSHYEQHLSLCPACRRNVVALVRLAEADALTSASPAREIPQPTWFSNARRVFGSLSQPQWAMAAAAVIVLAIGLPLVLSRDWNRAAPQTAAVASQPAEAQSAPAAPASLASNSASVDAGSGAVATDKLRDKQEEKGDGERAEVLARQPSAKPADAPALAGVASVDSLKKQETRAAGEAGEEAQRKSDSQLAPAQTQAAGAAPGSQVAKTESDAARQQQPQKDAAQAANESKALRADQESTEKEKTRRVEEAAAPPAPPAENSRDRAGFRRAAPRLSLRDSETTEAVRAEERKVGGRKFLFRDGAWTDKDFDPNKDLPIVTVIRDSNVYKELLSKRTGLKPIMDRFAPTERAIIVYKGTVYKLIPQTSEK